MRFSPVIAAALFCSLSPAVAQQSSRRVAPFTAGPERRLALVVGNDTYPAMPLRNARNDARSVRTGLAEAGFEVDYAEDTTLRIFSRAVDRFAERLRPGDVALFYYSGHGMQLDGRNYLVPVDFSAETEADVEFEAYQAARVQRKLEEKGARLVILVLDACRDNPFRFGRSAAGGLSAMREGVGTLIAFAAAEGQKADDNPSGANGLFTQHFVAALREPGLPLRDLFFKVQQEVYEASNHKQFPYVHVGVVGEFFIRPGTSTSGGRPGPADPETVAWEAVEHTDDAAVIEAFLKEFPSGRYAPTARVKLAVMRGSSKPPVQTRVEPLASSFRDGPCAITGRVIGKDGTAVGGAIVWTFKVDGSATYRAQTDEGGAFSMSGLPVGVYQFIIEVGGARFAPHESAQAAAGQTVSFTADLGRATEEAR